MNTKRLFIGIPVPASVQGVLEGRSRNVPIPRSALKVVPPPLYHVTLVFIGATPEDALPTVVAATQVAARTVAKFAIVSEHIALLPPRIPHTVGVTVVPSPSLQTLYDTLTRVLVAHKLIAPSGRQFHPHVTLARIRRGAQGEKSFPLRSFDEPCALSWDATSVIIYESHLEPGGSRYDVLHSTLLASQ